MCVQLVLGVERVESWLDGQLVNWGVAGRNMVVSRTHRFMEILPRVFSLTGCKKIERQKDWKPELYVREQGERTQLEVMCYSGQRNRPLSLGQE